MDIQRDRPKSVSRENSSKGSRSDELTMKFAALSLSPFEEKFTEIAKPRVSTRLFQPGAQKQALTENVNSPRARENAAEQENLPPSGFLFIQQNGRKSVAGKPPISPRNLKRQTLAPSNSAAALSPKPIAKPEHRRNASQPDSLNCDLSTAVTQVRRSESESCESANRNREKAHKEYLVNTFQAVKFAKNIPQIDISQLSLKMVSFPRQVANRKTVIFDLDETLVHCVEDASKSHVAIPVSFPGGTHMIAGVNIRPFAKECLSAISSFCEVMVFTASQQCYADQVLDYLDPKRSLVTMRLYRDSCVVVDGVYVKDLRILGNRRLKDLIIVDNAAYSFSYQLDNGIPILSWYDDPSDRELFNLIDYIRTLSLVDDVRVTNRETFRLHAFLEEYAKDCLHS